MRNVLQHIATLTLGIALALGWTGLVCLNSGDPDYTDQFWFYGVLALVLSHASFFCSTRFEEQRS